MINTIQLAEEMMDYIDDEVKPVIASFAALNDEQVGELLMRIWPKEIKSQAKLLMEDMLEDAKSKSKKDKKKGRKKGEATVTKENILELAASLDEITGPIVEEKLGLDKSKANGRLKHYHTSEELVLLRKDPTGRGGPAMNVYAHPSKVSEGPIQRTSAEDAEVQAAAGSGMVQS